MKDILAIIRRNLLSPIVIAILILALILLWLEEYRDAWFVSIVVLINSTIAIIQESRARQALKKLELMNMPRANRLLPDGTIEAVMFDELNVGDMVRLQLGDEVPADGKIITNEGLEADESILTGESAPVNKPQGSIIYAGSSVVAGSAKVLVTAVGVDSKMGTMSKKLKRYKPQLTPTQKVIAQAISFLTYGALFLAVLIYITYSFLGMDGKVIFKTITSAAVTVVPEGLLLGSSLLLAYGSLKLASVKVLPQKLAAIEAMALLNILCVDKTGTLTSDEIKFEKLEIFGKGISNLPELVGIAAKETNSGNKTGNAIADGLPAPDDYKILQTLAFSSERKMSGVQAVFKGKKYTILTGAPEFLSELAHLTSRQSKRVEQIASEGKRVLLVAMFDNLKSSIKDIPKCSGKAVGAIVLSNELRHGVRDTVDYLQQLGVSLRVISGDSPGTVQYIAAQAGIKNPNKVITGAELAKVSDKDWSKTVNRTTIFARVLPEQKERLIATFKKSGYFTGMVGDGVNDALALKKADLGVAMYAGAAATRRIADIILLDNSFNSLPIGMRLGNRIMQAIEIIATLFFHKIIYGVVLLFATLSLGIVYPFQPRHITFMNIFLVTMPTIMWTLFPPSPKHHVSPKYFWRDTLGAVTPIAVLSGIIVTIIYLALGALHPADPSGVATTTVIVATFLGVYLVFLVPKMLNVKNTKKAQLARALYILSITIVVASSFGFRFAREFFDFTIPAWRNVWPLVILLFGALMLQWQMAKKAGNRLKEREQGVTKR